MLHNIGQGDCLFLKIGFLDNGLGEKCTKNINSTKKKKIYAIFY